MSDDLQSDQSSERDPDDASSAASTEEFSKSDASGAGEDDERTVISKEHLRRQPQAFSPSEVGAALQGVQLGHFRLEKFVGGGGMGAVFRGLDTTLGRVVAVKVIPSHGNDGDTLRRFRNEAQSAARLDHPNIARVYYVGEDKGWNFIVFEFIQGVNVRELVEQRGPLSVAESVSYTLQVADALAHASDRDVVHRDIKPSNILVMPNGHAKLVDMGLARLHQVDAPSNDLTASGVTLGTFDYISPEQARDPRRADARSDLYSLGCTFFFMLTGIPPFPHGTVLQKLLSHSSDAPPDPRELRPSVGDEIAAVALKLMAKQPGQRYQTPHELSADLRLIADLLGLEGIPRSQYAAPPIDVAWPTRLAWHLPWVVSVCLLLVASAVMQSFWRPSDSDIVPASPKLGSATILPSPRAEEESEAAVPPAVIRDVDGLPPPGQAAEVEPFLDGGADAKSGTGSSVGAAVSPEEPPPRSEIVVPRPSSEELEPVGTATMADTAGPPASAGDVEVANSADPEMDAVSGTTRTLIVGPPAADVPLEGERVVASLAAAFRLANQLPGVETIELRFDEREELPLTIDLRRSLTIRAGDGFQPLIIFRPAGGALVPEWRMLKLFGDHRLHFAGIHFRLELPYETTPPCSLFDLNQINRVSLTGCTLTIRNEFGVPAAFFAVQAPRVSATISDQNAIKSPSIELNRTIARGEATLVRATKGLPFWLTWEQGLFTSTERMVETGGLPERPRLEVVRIDLTNVTASMDLGLCRVSIDDNGPYLPAIDILFRNCVLTHGVERPLVEHVGVASLADAEEKFGFAGQQNYYESTEIRWRVRTAERAVFDFYWTDRDRRWYEERFAERVVRWADEYRIKPSVFKQTMEDFRLDASQRRIAGFDEERLPRPPTTERESSVGMTPQDSFSSEL